MKRKTIICILLAMSMAVAGCGPDFGDKIYKWVKKNARAYSEQLTRKDLSERWLETFNETYRSIAWFEALCDSELNKVSLSTQKIAVANGRSLQELIDLRDRSKRNIDQLIKTQHTLAEIKYLFGRLDSIGTWTQFEQAGLRAVGKETLLRSFMEIGDVHEEMNRLRFRNLFSVKYTISMNTETGEVTHEASENNTAQTYSGSFEGWLASFFLTAPFYAIFTQDDVEDQIEKIEKSLDLFDELALQQPEQFKISQAYADSARMYFQPFHLRSDSIFTGQKQTWRLLYDVNLGLYRKAAEKLLVYQRHAAEDEIGGMDEVSRLVREEQLFQTRQQLVDMTAELFVLEKTYTRETIPLKKLEAAEALLDACIEAGYITDALLNKLEYTAIKDGLLKTKSTITRLQTEAETLLHDE